MRIPPVQSPPVPELPDLDVVADAFHAALAGRPLTGARALMPLAVRGTPAELAALEGQRVVRVARVGKFLDIVLDRDRVVVNPMLTGRGPVHMEGRPTPKPGRPVLAGCPRMTPQSWSAIAIRRRWARSTFYPTASTDLCPAADLARWAPTRWTYP